jgi:sigma-E factor negative regulatory protein RseC
MAIEEGIVYKLGDTQAKTAWVRTTRSSACESCSSRDACHLDGGDAAGKEMTVEAVNLANARVGDRIVLNIKTTNLLKATFLLYVFPILALIAGALLGQTMAGMRGGDPSVWAASTGFLFFSLAFVIIRFADRRLSTDSHYKPVIIKVRPHRPASADTDDVTEHRDESHG